MVTALQEEQIRLLRSQGVGYRQIANQLNLSRDAVRYYCKANNLNGQGEAVQANIQRIMTDDTVCSYCGELLVQPKTGRKRRFCCEACRRKWWGQNRDKIRKGTGAIYGFTCKRCGKEFTAYWRVAKGYAVEQQPDERLVRKKRLLFFVSVHPEVKSVIVYSVFFRRTCWIDFSGNCFV